MTAPRRLWRAAGAAATLVAACRSNVPAPSSGETTAVSSASPEPAGSNTELRAGVAPSTEPQAVSGPLIAATTIATTVYSLPNTEARRLGYIRLGGKVRRDADPVSGTGCKGSFYHVYPVGYVCTDEATIDLQAPLVRAASRGPDLSKPLPYRYGFVRATAPQYLAVPTRKEQTESEFKLDEHLAWFVENRLEVQRAALGANDVPLDSKGLPRMGLAHPAGHRLSTQLSLTELFGGSVEERIPWWLQGGRKVPNVSGFDVPEYALFADRVRRKTGLSFVDAFNMKEGDFERRFAVTVDLRLIPTTKVKPDTGSMFHGVLVEGGLEMPFAFVVKRETTLFHLIKGRDEAEPTDRVPRRALIPLSGKARVKGGRRFYQTSRDPKNWLQAADIGVVAPPPSWPEAAEKGEKWLDISLVQQTLVLYEGKRAWYATLVSSGQDRLGDPETSKATPRGVFRLRSKHIAAAMDSEENSTVLGGQKAERKLSLDAEAVATIDRVKKAEAAGNKLSEEDQRRLSNVKKGRHPEYGVTMRRGSDNFELRDVPWIQYFASGYALHGAYWHDVFGIPRSHGCVNLSPIDARLVFFWTTPSVPDGWHGVNVGDDFGTGTTVVVRE